MEKKIVLANCGIVDPGDIESYREHDGFKALEAVKGKMSPEQVSAEIKASGLRGRGGAGFNCGLKWELARKVPGDEKYLICNADEGEVGTFKDRYILEKDPFSLIEGIAIAAYAIGARKTFIYLREEYHFLLDALIRAIQQAEDRDFLENLDIEVREGAGAYICGEESALMNSIEGFRGEARFKPPFPPTQGLWEKPTIINNVETLANIPRILFKGASWYKGIGTESSKGTKVFSISGDVERSGVYELEMGSSLKELAVSLAGAEDIKMIQVGGATGRILPAAKIDTPLAFESVLGSGAVIVFNESRDVIDIVNRNAEFLAEESCGKCTPCREGMGVMVEILNRLDKGDGIPQDIPTLETLGHVMKDTSLCGLGSGAPVPVLDSLLFFKNEYNDRVRQSQFLRSLPAKSYGGN